MIARIISSVVVFGLVFSASAYASQVRLPEVYGGLAKAQADVILLMDFGTSDSIPLLAALTTTGANPIWSDPMGQEAWACSDEAKCRDLVKKFGTSTRISLVNTRDAENILNFDKAKCVNSRCSNFNVRETDLPSQQSIRFGSEVFLRRFSSESVWIGSLPNPHIPSIAVITYFQDGREPRLFASIEIGTEKWSVDVVEGDSVFQHVTSKNAKASADNPIELKHAHEKGQAKGICSGSGLKDDQLSRVSVSVVATDVAQVDVLAVNLDKNLSDELLRYRIQHGLAQTTAASIRSDVQVVFNPVGMLEETGCAVTSSFGPARLLHDLISCPTVAQERSKLKADLILGFASDMVGGHGQACEIGASVETAYAVVNNASILVDYGVAHEVGHLLGARHQRIRGDDFHKYPGNNFGFAADGWGSVMIKPNEIGCANCTRLLFWSNPRMKLTSSNNGSAKNVPVGSNHRANNALVVGARGVHASSFLTNE